MEEDQELSQAILTMTEADWLSSADPLLLMGLLEGVVRNGEVSDRTIRLFACACSRRLWHMLTEDARRDVLLAERFVDGQASEEELSARCREVDLADVGRDGPGGPAVARCCVLYGIWDGGHYRDEYWQEVKKAVGDERGTEEGAARSALLRDIFGNPFRHVPFDPGCRTRSTVGIASKMYEERDFVGMPVLADALEETGCVHADILTHCREPDVHVRGCWVVDLLL
jgi:hypothetical protein